MTYLIKEKLREKVWITTEGTLADCESWIKELRMKHPRRWFWIEAKR